ncbi:hypothetical protein HELRODRAFT_188607 [Helobdella robusta]|uniref:Uncharacterized protein n=1 Tax=Helobdella robusta TaxID=6412 RepID=T1FQ64_HELRO|nr:hypothetical protein HELRODRAFT_188607 [Helobdella robusta]ESO02173.1 hypothetical protein HELRODRAFT_188607 [Helobdella robusta]
MLSLLKIQFIQQTNRRLKIMKIINFSLILSLLLTLLPRNDATYITEVVSPCPVLKVEGAFDREMNGVYWLDRGSQCVPSWVSMTEGQFNLFYLENSFDGWVLSSHACHNWGGFRALAQTQQRDLPFSNENFIWKELNPTNNLIEVNALLKISCLENFDTSYYESCLFTRCLHTNEPCSYDPRYDKFSCITPEKNSTSGESLKSSQLADRNISVLVVVVVECLLLMALLAVVVTCLYRVHKMRSETGYNILRNFDSQPPYYTKL